MRSNLLIFLLILSVPDKVLSQKTASIEGIYTGKDPLFSVSYDTMFYPLKLKVNVNLKYDTVFTIKRKKEEYELRLDRFRFGKGDTVILRTSIIPKAMCHIDDSVSLKPFACRSQLMSVTCTPEGTVRWTAQYDSGAPSYMVEQFRWGKWIEVGEVPAKKRSGLNDYSFPVKFHFGENVYRIHQHYGCYSRPVKVESDVPEVGFIGDLRKDLVFDAETDYEVYDSGSNLLLTGRSTKIELGTLNPGVYYLNYDNKTTEFIKRK